MGAIGLYRAHTIDDVPGTVTNPVAEPSSKRRDPSPGSGSSDSDVDVEAAANADAVAEIEAAPLELQAEDAEEPEEELTEADLAACQLFSGWLAAEKAAEAAAEKLRREQEEADVSAQHTQALPHQQHALSGT